MCYFKVVCGYMRMHDTSNECGIDFKVISVYKLEDTKKNSHEDFQLCMRKLLRCSTCPAGGECLQDDPLRKKITTE